MQDLNIAVTGVATPNASWTVEDLVERYRQTVYDNHLDERALAERTTRI